MKNVTRILLITFVFLISVTSTSPVLANPTVIQTTIDPAKPLPLSIITVNTTILANETIDEVQLLVQECRDDVCSIHDFNISMKKIATGTYQVQYKLIQEEATQLKYHLKIACNETWYTSNTTFIPLASSTPGFELVLLFFSVGLLLMGQHYKKKINRDEVTSVEYKKR